MVAISWIEGRGPTDGREVAVGSEVRACVGVGLAGVRLAGVGLALEGSPSISVGVGVGACSISIVPGVEVGVGIGIGVKVAVGSALPHPTSRIAIVTETAQIKVLDIS